MVLKYFCAIFEASIESIGSASGATSIQSKLQGKAASVPRVATESKKHVARSGVSFWESLAKNGFDGASNRKVNDGVPVRVRSLAVPESRSDLVGVEGG